MLALSTCYSIEPQYAKSIVKKLKIFHPYGVVGDYPWQSGNQLDIHFGKNLNATELLKQTQKIKTYSEQLEEKSILEEIKNEIAEARTLVFLGMAYHDQNMKIMLPNVITKTKRVYGTAYGMSKNNTKEAENQIMSMLSQQRRPTLAAMEINRAAKCADLFDEYYKSLISFSS